ncbi:MAG: excinuclease ABC subunit UvrC [Clostridiales bacterium]|nr:excinuclease ABC subunit UvrC [Clostridiales bacterium]
MMLFDFEKELKELPGKPGVYIMKDANETVIYVGKSKVLKNRVRQYFKPGGNKGVKVNSMVSHIASFEYIVTATEVEALILENNLIKKYSPKYNIMLTDDKTYPYIKLTSDEMFPRVFMTRQRGKDKAKYFGPFTSSTMVKENLEVINNVWQLRRCSKKFPRDIGKERPCLNYHIGKCLAPCTGRVSEEEYKIHTDRVEDFLNGKQDKILKELEEKMLKASEDWEFEKAAKLRDSIAAIKKLGEKQVVEDMADCDRDVVGVARANGDDVVQVFFIRGGKLVVREHFMLSYPEECGRAETVENFIKQFYGGTPFVPKEIFTSVEIGDKAVIEEWLSEIKGRKVSLVSPKKGSKLKLCKLADENALVLLDKFGEEFKREQRRTTGALEEIKKAIGAGFDINRIESYDISNTQGFESVASMVVFEGGKPKKSDYRKFKIKTVYGANDYASMEEVLTRRFMRYKNETAEKTEKPKFNILPDVLFIDGGKGHVHIAEQTLKKLGIGVPVCGMVKDSRHRTRGLIYGGKEVLLPPNSEGFKLVTRIQDEVHRFAIEYHRRSREKREFHSVLEDIKGIGEVRRKRLIKRFGDIEGIKRASVDELTAVEGMDSRSAEAVFDFFHKKVYKNSENL